MCERERDRERERGNYGSESDFVRSAEMERERGKEMS